MTAFAYRSSSYFVYALSILKNDVPGPLFGWPQSISVSHSCIKVIFGT
jgi:hypothetical protein